MLVSGELLVSCVFPFFFLQAMKIFLCENIQDLEMDSVDGSDIKI